MLWGYPKQHYSFAVQHLTAAHQTYNTARTPHGPGPDGRVQLRAAHGLRYISQFAPQVFERSSGILAFTIIFLAER
eukprot:13457320-Heterocapsa_arctica.AAC.1